jgi:anti-sigma regulatory factor (Ser/Thr protein kinase)
MPEELQFTIRNDLRELARVGAESRAFLVERRVDDRSLYVALLALEEVLSNVIRHGFADTDEHEISVSLGLDDGRIEIDVVDGGRAFDPLSAPEVDLQAPMEQRAVGGLGIHLLRTMVHEIRYERAEGRNRLRLRI